MLTEILLSAAGFQFGQYDYEDSKSLTKTYGEFEIHIVAGNYVEPGDGLGRYPDATDKVCTVLISGPSGLLYSGLLTQH